MSELLGATGCSHEVNVPPRDVTSIVQRYQAGEPVVIDDPPGPPVELTKKRSPELAIKRSDCGFFEYGCPFESSAPLEAIRIVGGRLSLPRNEGREWTKPLLPENIREATVAVSNYDPPGWRPTWGFGGGIGGATGFAAVQGHWRPEQWLGMELGTILVNAPVLSAYAAMRIRLAELGPVAPLIGWFINGFSAGPGDNGHPGYSYSGAGPRVGLELDVVRGHLVSTLEGDLVHPLGGDHAYFGERGEWVPWGGASVVWFP